MVHPHLRRGAEVIRLYRRCVPTSRLDARRPPPLPSCGRAPPPPLAAGSSPTPGSSPTIPRRGLELSRLFPDPCCRHYLFNRVAQVFRSRAKETSPKAVSMHIKQARNLTRRMRRAAREGRVRTRRAARVRRQGPHAPPHRRRAERRERGGEAEREPTPQVPPSPTPGVRGAGDVHDQEPPRARRGASGESPRPSSPADVSDAAARQLAALRDLVPSVWERRARRATTTGEDGGEDEDERDGGLFFDDDDDDDDDDARSGSRASARGRGGKYRAGHFQGLAPWDVDRASPPGPAGRVPRRRFAAPRATRGSGRRRTSRSWSRRSCPPSRG